MGIFDVQAYNQLLIIDEADSQFKQQLSAAGISREDLFLQLAPLFAKKEQTGKKPYGICLLHRHYLLNDGERMVSSGNSIQPSTDKSPNIVADRWFASGQEFEHTCAEAPLYDIPSFLSEFKAINDVHGINILGVTYIPDLDNLGEEFTMFEEKGSKDREQITTIVRQSSLNPDTTIEATWIIHGDPNQPCRGRCTSVCNGCPP